MKEFKSFKINGVDVSEFKIFAVDNIDEGQALANDIKEKYLGIELPIESGKARPTGDKYIILDRQSYAYHDYSMTVEGGNLVINGSFRSFPKAIELFVAYLDGSHGDDVNITSADNASGKIPTVKPLYSTKEELFKIYQYAMDNGYTLYGEHWGGGWATMGELKEGIRKCVGDGPAILDIDMISFYIEYLSRSEISRVIAEALEFAAEGGIVTTFCHWQNPNEETRIIDVKQPDGSVVKRDSIYRGSIGSPELWKSVLTEGTEFNTKWKKQLDCNAEVYQAFKDLGLPVTFRPMLEANSGNMWWCAIHEGCMLSGDDLRDMWNYVYDYYVNKWNFDHILWSYAPEMRVNPDYEGTKTTYFYPGDDKCDLVGSDWYIGNWMSRNNYDDSYGYKEISAYGKPTGLCEWGIMGAQWSNPVTRKDPTTSFSYDFLVDIIREAKRAGYPICFVESYSGYFGSTTWLLGGHELNEAPEIILLDDMPEFIKKALAK